MEGSRTSPLGSVEMGLQKSHNAATLDRLVWAARSSTGLPALVKLSKALGKTEWREFSILCSPLLS